MRDRHACIGGFRLEAFENRSSEKIPAPVGDGDGESPSRGFWIEGFFGEELGPDQIQCLMHLNIELVGFSRCLNGSAAKEKTITHQMSQATDGVANCGLTHVETF